jgi:hypothetical protein
MSCVHRALARELGRRYPDLRLRTSRSEDWASVTFVGARHCFEFDPAPAPADLMETEFTLPGHIVADIAVMPSPDRLVIEALTLVSD